MPRRIPAIALTLSLLAVVGTPGCLDREPAPVCPVPTELSQSERMLDQFEGLDLIVVVDNSASMGEEQAILSTAIFDLVNSLANPVPGWGYPSVDDIRIAVVTSDMGLQYGDQPYDQDEFLLVQLDCTDDGDDGAHQTYGAGERIDILSGVIRCGHGGDQCPPGWECADLDEAGVGTCVAPGGDGTNQICPGLGSTWAETAPGAPNPDLAFQVACMAEVGTEGCGFEQQLQAGRRGLLTNPDFIRDEALLGVLVVSDEEDCSIEDGTIFQQPEITDLASPHELNLLCGRHQELLYEPEYFKEAFVAAKGGREEAVVFAAIAGVPPVPACEGRGADLDACLDHEKMQLNEILEESWVYAPACERYAGAELVTKARPGRRYVDLAGQMKQRSYVYSICNESWSPAMSDIAALIADQFKGTCYPKPLQWDPATRQARCDVVVEYLDTDECPFELDDGKSPSRETFEDADGVEHERLSCPLPRLAAPLDCQLAAAAMSGTDDEIGWYYCEDNTESFEAACDPNGAFAGLDEDRDGLVDCADPDCAACQVCDPSSAGCGHACRYSVRLTDGAEQITLGRQLSLQCLQQFELDDDNCAEITAGSCTDGRDNDGNGVWDCDDDLDGDTPHRADPACCPLGVDADNSCIVDDAVFANCDGSTPANLPDACRAAAQLLGCVLP